MFIKLSNKEHHRAMIAILKSYGFKIFDDSPMDAYTDRAFDDYNSIVVTFEYKTIAGNAGSGRDYDIMLSFKDDLPKILEILATPIVTLPEPIKISSTYKVVFHEDKSIEVGCQTISFNLLEKIYNTAKDIK